jgi:triphosphoribosyl-dephospho-CoA synthase
MSVSIRDAVLAACTFEVMARKPGNVNPELGLNDRQYKDYRLTAWEASCVLGRAGQEPLGTTILRAIESTQQMVGHNTNLGIILLLAPLAAVPRNVRLSEGVLDVIAKTDVEDSKKVYQAIRLAKPAGLGQVREQDIGQEPTLPLQAVMRLAADRDMVARQYVNGFSDVLEFGVPILARRFAERDSLEAAIVVLHLEFMSQYPDSLIARKRGEAEARQAGRLAREALDHPEDPSRLARLDEWLRAVGNQRNPGTSADLVAATLFAVFREGLIPMTAKW